MAGPFEVYFAAIKNLDIHDATEHTLRGPLENLLQAVAGQGGKGWRADRKLLFHAL